MKKYNVRLRPNEARGQSSAGRHEIAIRTQEEVAAILGWSKQYVQQIELRALRKLSKNRELRELWQTWKKSLMEVY